MGKSFSTEDQGDSAAVALAAAADLRAVLLLHMISTSHRTWQTPFSRVSKSDLANSLK